MARARNIKPALFKNEVLGVANPLYTLLFEGLWTLADREGRLEDRPLRIKAEIFPYRDNVCVDKMLDWLHEQGFIVRYCAAGVRCIEVTNFMKHQNPHKNEIDSVLPAPEDGHAALGPAREPALMHESRDGGASEKLGTTPADSLIVDSLTADPGLLMADSPMAESLTADPLCSAGVADALPGGPRKMQPWRGHSSSTEAAWTAYANAYRGRYEADPVRNATTNAQMASFVKRLGAVEAPEVAEFFVWHNAKFYVQQMHGVGAMLRDAEKLRTEWATGKRMTETRARQADRTQNTGDVFAELIREAEVEHGIRAS
ncbi:hypothetical protein [Paracidovorax citrulli]